MKKNKSIGKFTQADYIKAVKRVDREVQLQNSSGFRSVTKVHISKKHYKRREGKKIDFDTLSFA